MEDTTTLDTRKQNLMTYFKKNMSWITYVVLLFILGVNIYLRTLPMRLRGSRPGLWDVARDNWTLGPDLDPFLFLRYAKIIVEQGHLPAVDMMRYVPVGYVPAGETRLLPYAIAYLHHVVSFFKEVPVEYSAVIFPVVFSVFAAIAFFLLVKKIFENKGQIQSTSIALLATMFMVTLPSLLSRTIAGIPEKESMGFGLMFFAFYLFLAAWKARNTRTAVILGALAGLFTGLMALVWGGIAFIFTTLAIAGFIALLFEQVNRKTLLVYSSWIIVTMASSIPFTLRMSLEGFVTTFTSGSSFFVWLCMLMYFGLYKTRVREWKILRHVWIQRVPRPVVALIGTLVLAFVLSIIVFGPSTFVDIGKDAVTRLYLPQSERHALTVAENRQPYFSEWRNNFGPLVQNIPLFFWLFFIGSVVLFYTTIKKLSLSERVWLTSAWIFFLLALIFSRAAPDSRFNGTSGVSLLVYALGYIVFITIGGWAYYRRYQDNRQSIFRSIQFEYIFVFSLIFIGIIAARSAVRLIMVLAPIATIPLSFLCVGIIVAAFNRARSSHKDSKKVVAIGLAIIIILAVPYMLYYNYQVSKNTGLNHIPSSYTQQWQKAMGWVRDNTPTNAVFGHWWDYGYWVQTMGERATMLDGSNSKGYWNYLMGRHVLTAESEDEALQVLYNHNITHFLIDSSEIGKYSAYSSIGSDEQYDRYSWIGTFALDHSQVRETQNGTLLVYTGGIALDGDIRIMQEGKEILLPQQHAGVGALVVPISTLSSIRNTDSFGQPYALIIYNGKQHEVQLRYLFINDELVDFGTGIDAATYIFPRLNLQEGGVQVDNVGAALFLSPKNMRALWVRLYLLKEGTQFQLAHAEPSFVVTELQGQGIALDSDDIIYYQGIQGPIKIWDVIYTGKETYDESLIQSDFPDDIKDRVLARL